MDQHADDTTIHTATVEGAQQALQQALKPFCQATGSRLSLPKTKGMVLGSHPPLSALHAGTGAVFVSQQETIRHLGILLTTGDRTAAAHLLYQKRLVGIHSRIAHWQKISLSHLGRVHVAKQVLANTLAYHATFVQPTQQQQQAIQIAVDWYVLQGQLVQQQDGAILQIKKKKMEQQGDVQPNKWHAFHTAWEEWLKLMWQPTCKPCKVRWQQLSLHPSRQP